MEKWGIFFIGKVKNSSWRPKSHFVKGDISLASIFFVVVIISSRVFLVKANAAQANSFNKYRRVFSLQYQGILPSDIYSASQFSSAFFSCIFPSRSIFHAACNNLSIFCIIPINTLNRHNIIYTVLIFSLMTSTAPAMQVIPTESYLSLWQDFHFRWLVDLRTAIFVSFVVIP